MSSNVLRAAGFSGVGSSVGLAPRAMPKPAVAVSVSGAGDQASDHVSSTGMIEPKPESQKRMPEALRGKIFASMGSGPEGLCERIGKTVLQDVSLLSVAGEYLAVKYATPSAAAQMIDAVVEIGEGKFPGLGYSFATTLQKIAKSTNLQIRDDLKIFSGSYADFDDFTPWCKEHRIFKVVVITPVRIVDTARRIDDLINSDLVSKVVTLVCYNDNNDPTKYVSAVTINE